MKRTPAWLRGLAACVLYARVLVACVEVPDFPDPSLIDRPRVLAIVADPPEVNPGTDVALSLLFAGAEEYTASWRACGAFDAFGNGGAQYGDDEPDEGCGASVAIELGAGDGAVLPGEITRRLFDDLELAAVILGAELPAGTLEHIRDNVGLPFLVEVTIDAGDKHIRAVKRVLVSQRAAPHTNPPPPRFLIGSREVTGEGGVPFTCAAANFGVLPALPTGKEVELAPVIDGDAEVEPWLERYQIIDLRGELREREETAFYSWFSTAGALQEGVTKSPLRNEIWRTPRDSGCYPLWLVVRDGHGGTSACGLDVAVGDATCD